MHVARLIQAVVNSVPASTDVHVNFSAGGPQGSSQQQQQNAGSGANQHDIGGGEPGNLLSIFN